MVEQHGQHVDILGGASGTTTIGALTNFTTRTVSLSSYTNAASVMIRFRYSSSSNYYWAIDDVNIKGTNAPGNYSWTVSPTLNAGLPSGADISSPGNSDIVVTPTAIGTFTYTAILTNTAGCMSTKDVQVTVKAVPTVTISASYCPVAGQKAGTVRLTATATPGATLLWSTGATSSFIDVDIAAEYSVMATLGGCPATAYIDVAQELVINGDFENGNDGSFTTSYIAATPWNGNCGTPLSPTGLMQEGKYDINTDGQNTHCNFWGTRPY